MAKASPIQTSFNAGEFGPELDGRVDIGKYGNACSRMENFIPLIQGPARRRGGTYFVNEVKSSANRTWLARFEFNTEQAYVLEFGNLYVRFYTDNGILESSPGVPVEVVTPWSSADMLNADGSFALQMVQSGDILYICHPSYAPRKLARTGATTWTLSTLVPDGGPFDDYDPDQTTTIYASAATGTGVTLTALTGIFASTDVGRLFYLEQKKANSVGQWETGKSITANDLRRSDGKTYKALNTATTGSIKPTHTVGAEYDGNTGVQWEFQDAGYGWVEITGFTTISAVSRTITGAANNGAGLIRITATAHGFTSGDAVTIAGVTGTTEANGSWYITVITANTFDLVGSTFTNAYVSGGTADSVPGSRVTVTVLSPLPSLTVGSSNATTRWAFGSWGSVPGYPSHVTFFRSRLLFARARDRKLWFSVSGDFENFRDRDEGGNVVADMAISLTVESDESNQIQYVVPSDALIIGTAAGEHVCMEQTDSEPFGPANAKIVKSSDFGSRGVQPVRVGDSILFVQRSGRKLREISFDALSNGYKSLDMSVLAPHMVPKGKSIVQMAYQKEPHSIIWVARSDGLLLAFTFNREQYTEPPFGGWHRHPLGGDAIVESLVCVPSPEDDRDDLWMVVRRTINGSTKRYVEYMRAEWESGDDQADAFYVDCGLSYDGAPATTISGLGHLEGKTVDILADGASHPQSTVASGAITLQRSASVVHVGLPCPAKLATMRLEAGATDGTAQGKTKRINRMVVRLLDTLGGGMGPSETEIDEILFRSSGDPMDAAPPVFTGDKELPWPGGYGKDAYVWYVNDQPLPATVSAIMPQVTTQDR